jgi:hypothetical protein
MWKLTLGYGVCVCVCVYTRAVQGVKTIALLFYIFWWVLGKK